MNVKTVAQKPVKNKDKKTTPQKGTPQKGTPQKGAPKKKGARATFWTDDRVSRLISWHNKLTGKNQMFERIAGKLKTSRHAVYKKLGRLGRLNAKWASKFVNK